MSQNERTGSLTIVHKRGDIIENTIGRIGALSTNILVWTPESIFQNISKEQAGVLEERYKNVNWRGDVKVFLNHNPLFDQLKRLYFEPGKRRTNFFLRASLGLPVTVLGWVSSKIYRSDYYNPLTETVTTYNRNTFVASHEIGHAEYFDKSNHPGLQALAGIIPGVKSYQEWAASNNAMKHLNYQEREKARKVLEPAWGTYAGFDAASIGSSLYPPIVPLITSIVPFASIIGLVAGHIHSRIPGSHNIFFDETSVDNIVPVQSYPQPALAPAASH